MSQGSEVQAIPKKKLLSIDGWAVLIAFALAALIRAGVLKHIPW